MLRRGGGRRHGERRPFLGPGRQDQAVQGGADALAPPRRADQQVDHGEGAARMLGRHLIRQRGGQVPPPGGGRPEREPGRVTDQVTAVAGLSQDITRLAALNPEAFRETRAACAIPAAAGRRTPRRTGPAVRPRARWLRSRRSTSKMMSGVAWSAASLIPARPPGRHRCLPSIDAALAAAVLRIGTPPEGGPGTARSAEGGVEPGAQVAQPLDRLVGEHQAQVPLAAGPPSGHRGGRDLGPGEEAL